MEVSVWVPVAVAVIAAVPLLLATRTQRTNQQQDAQVREAELAVSGLAVLVNELQEERAECKAELVALRQEMIDLRRRVGTVEREVNGHD